MKLNFSIIVTLAPFLFSCYLWEEAYCSTIPAPLREPTAMLSVTNGGKRGSWGRVEFCMKGAYAIAFRLKVQSIYSVYSDETTLNGIKLICSHGYDITSTEGRRGKWRLFKPCNKGYFLMEFLLIASKHVLLADNTAANNIVFRCTDSNILIGDGINLGYIGEQSGSCTKGICGLQTRVEQPGFGNFDLTGLNDVRFFCCQD